MLRILGILLLLLGPCGPGFAQPVSITRADEQLQDLLGVQRELLARAAAAELPEEVEQLRPRLQELVFDWEDYLRSYADKPEGYIAYSMLLGNPLIDERKRAKALLLRANQLDPNLPLVKNQLGKYLAEEGLPLEALPYFLAAVQLAPDEPLYHYQVGQLLGGARSDFLTSGEWTAEAIDRAMQHAFAEAVRLNPDSLPYAYRHAESYYDVENPPWEEALAAWEALEARVASPTEKQMMRLHQANVRLYQGELDAAQLLLQEEPDGVLAGQRTRLLERLERLHNPGAVALESDAAPNPAEGEEPTPRESVRAARPFVVPEFRPVYPAEPVTVDSDRVVELQATDSATPRLPGAAPDAPMPTTE